MAISKERMRAYYREYVGNGVRTLDDVYGRYSPAKYRAWRDCERRCAEKGGYCLSVISHNTSYFSAGFMYEGEKGKMFYVITPSYTGEICVEDAQNGIF